MKNNLSKLVSSKAENVALAAPVSFSFLPSLDGFPLVIKPKYTGMILTEWVRENRKEFDKKLNIHGAILLRGFQIDTVDKFQNFIDVFEASPLAYKQRSSPRFEVAKNIYHSTTYPADQSINMHSENSYSLKWPRKISFCCIQPARVQGETPIADTRLVLKYLPDATRKKFKTKGVKYVRHISKWLGLPWQEVFQTTDRAVVEAECYQNGMEFSWIDDDRLMLTWNNGAIYTHPETGEEVWFNHAYFFNKYALSSDVLASIGSTDEIPFNTFFGDGTPISREEAEQIRVAYEKATIEFPWEKGDVLFMDNMLTAHGRSPYEGERQIIVSMF